MYALSPLEIVMQCPPVVECDDSQQPLALQPVFSEEDLASISSLNSKKGDAAEGAAPEVDLAVPSAAAAFSGCCAMPLSAAALTGCPQTKSAATLPLTRLKDPPERRSNSESGEVEVGGVPSCVRQTQPKHLRQPVGQGRTLMRCISPDVKPSSDRAV